MNTLKLKSIFATLLSCLFIVAVNAQSSDDLYYVPSTVSFTVEEEILEETASVEAVNDDTQFYNGDVSDYNQAYEDDYYYQSRLRRFCSPNSGLSYYSPAYTNSYYYNSSPFSWSNNIYNQQFYSQNWWTSNTRSYNNFFGWNTGFNNYNNRSNFSPYTSFGNTIYNTGFANRGFNSFNNGGVFRSNAFNDPCVVNNYVRNSINNYNDTRRTNSKSSINRNADRERSGSYRTIGNGDSRKYKSTGARSSSSSSGKSSTNSASKPRYRTNENATKTKKQKRSSNFFDFLNKKDNNSKDSYRDKNSRRNSGKSYRSGGSSGRSYGSSSRGSSGKSSGSRSSRSGGKR